MSLTKTGGEFAIVHEECVITEVSTICAPKPWLDLAISASSKLREPARLASRISRYRLLLIKVLRLPVYESSGNTIVWGVLGGGKDIVEVDLSDYDWYRLYSKKLPRLLALALAEPLRVLIFGLVGLTGIGVNLVASVTAYNLLTASGALAYPLASTTGFESSVLWNFLLHETITFRGRRISRSPRALLVRLVRYHFASIASYISQVSIATLLPVFLGVVFWQAQLLGILVGFVANFILGYAYTWSTHVLKGG